ncbi:hypothetical protein [Turicimonas sp. TL08]
MTTMKPNFNNQWPYLSHEEEVLLKHIEKFKTNVFKALELPAETKLIEVVDGNIVELKEPKKMNLAVFHFFNSNGERFALLTNTEQLQMIIGLFSKAPNEMNNEKEKENFERNKKNDKVTTY